MPVARFEMPDGRIARFEVPEGTTPEQAQAMIEESLNSEPVEASQSQGAWGKAKAADKVFNAAYRATPLGLIQTAHEKGNELVRGAADTAADKVMDATNSPALATLTKMSPDIAGLIGATFISGRVPHMIGGGKASRAASRVGVNPTWGQRFNNPTIMQVEDTMRRMPGSGGVFGANDARNQQAINKAAASAIGERGDRLTGEVLADAESRLGAERDVLRDAVNIKQGDPFVLKAIQSATANLKKSLRGSGTFNNDMERIKQRIAAGDVSGEQYQIWRTDLRNAMDTAFKGGKSKLGDAYREVLNALDDAARGGASEAWKANDKAFSTLDILHKGNVVNPETGNVSAPLLTNEFYRRFGRSAKQGRMPGPVADIATIQRAYPKWAEGSPTGKVEQYSSLVPWLLSPVNFAFAKVLTSNPYSMMRYAPYAASFANVNADDQRMLGLLYGND
jgi:hypothetical protein